jgi:hypothetical protein
MEEDKIYYIYCSWICTDHFEEIQWDNGYYALVKTKDLKELIKVD